MLNGCWFAGLFRDYSENLLMFIPLQTLGSLEMFLLVIFCPPSPGQFHSVAFVPETKEVLLRLRANSSSVLVKNDLSAPL